MPSADDNRGTLPRPPETGSADTSQRRADIGSGRARDKVANNDAAASPLGTDDEAGGAPDAAGAIERARREETGRG